MGERTPTSPLFKGARRTEVPVLLALLQRFAEGCRKLVALAESQRRRPRRKGKPA